MLHYRGNLFLVRNSSGDPSIAGEVLRDWFSKLDVQYIKPYRNHTHGESASVRTIGSNFIEDLAKASGNPIGFFQGSASDIRKGRDVSRDWFWAKDLSLPLSTMPKRIADDPNAIVAMVDVDEYIDELPRRLAVDFRPYAIYTFVPNQAAKNGGDYNYRFLADGRVEYVVSGGGVYTHPVWDFNHDAIKVTGYEWTWEGLCIHPLASVIKHTAFYKVERRNIDADHQVILLAPMKRWSETVLNPLSWPMSISHFLSRLKGAPLERFNPVEGNFVRVQRISSTGMTMSTAKVGSFVSVDTGVAVDDEISLKSELTKDKLSVSMAKCSLGDKTIVTAGAEILTAYHREKAANKPARVFSTTDDVRTYQFLPKLADHELEPKPMMHSFMKPIIDGAFAAAATKHNERKAVESRITKVRSDAKLTKFLREAIGEFTKLLVEDIEQHSVFPVDEDEVYARQTRPTQRAILEASNYFTSTGTSMPFIKRQCEGNVKDARLITVIDGADKKGYSAYQYALYDLIKHLRWYASGKVPREISESVAELCRLARWLLEGDFSRMDGRVSEVLRELERNVMMAVFHPCVHDAMLLLMRSQTWLKCKTRMGVSYNSGNARASGSAETSTFNTIASKFVSYLGMVLQIRARTGLYQWREAYNTDGAYQGDDSLTANLQVKYAVEAAAMVGQSLECAVKPRGSVISFLSRFYGPEVWYGSTDSCCDLLRQLTKFHTAVWVENDVKQRLTKLREKAFAFYLTDRNSPVLGPLVTKVLEIAPVQHGDGKGHKYTNILGIWNSEVPVQDQYLSLPDESGWKLQQFEQQCEQSKPSISFSVDAFKAWLDSCTTLEDIMNAPEAPRVEARHPGGDEKVEVDGDILQPAPAVEGKKGSKRGTRGGKRAGKKQDRTSPDKKRTTPDKSRPKPDRQGGPRRGTSPPKSKTDPNKTSVRKPRKKTTP